MLINSELNDCKLILQLWDHRCQLLGYKSFSCLCRNIDVGLSERTLQRWLKGELTMITVRSLIKIEILFHELETEKKRQGENLWAIAGGANGQS